MMDKPLVELEQVSKHYGETGAPDAVTVLQGIDLRVAAGDSVAVVGPSGSGKSTLLNLIGALDRPSAGRVRVSGQDLSDLAEAELAAFRNQRIGFVFQLHHLLPECSVLENVLVPTLPHPAHDAAAAATRAEALLGRVGLGDRLHHRPGQLSGGERQRAALVRALINEPDLLLADEPTGSLDRESSEQLTELLLELNREQNVTLVTVTHATALAMRMKVVLELREGRLTPARPAS